MALERIFVTGIGSITGCGVGTESLWSGLLSGQSAAGPLGGRAETGGPAQAVLCRSFDPAAVIGRRDVRRMDRTIALTAGATRLAFADGGLGEQPGAHWGFIGSCGLGPVTTIEQAVETMYRDGPSNLSPQMFANSVMNAAAGFAAMLYGLKGPSSVLAASNALAYAVDLLRTGRAEALCVAGGVEFSPTVYRGMAGCGLLAPDVARPYDTAAGGLMLGEAGAALLLESESHLRRRGGRAHAEIAAYSEGYEPCQSLFCPAPDGGEAMAANIRQVLAEAGLDRGDLDAVWGAGNGLRAVDRAEAQALHATLGRTLREMALTSIQGATGVTPGVQGLLAVASAALALSRGTVPPTAGCTTPDLDLALPVVTGEPVGRTLRHVLVQTLEQEGEAVSYLLRRVEA